MKKKFLKMILFVVIALFNMIFIGCGNDKQNEEKNVSTAQIELKFLHKWPQEENSAYFKEVVAEFEKENPNIKIVMEGVGEEPIKDKLRILMGTDEQPDVFFSWSGEFAKKFIRSENALDLTPYLEKDKEWKDSIMTAGLEPFSDNGKNYGIPFRINGKFFVYNKKIFEENEIKAPETWKEFLNNCDILKKKGITPIGLGNIYPWAACHYITGLNQKMVPDDIRKKDYIAETGEFTNEGYVTALKMLKELNDKGYFNKGINSVEHNMSLEMFYAGQVAMTYIELEEFLDVEKKLGDHWGFFAMPRVEGALGNQNFLTGAPDGFMISAKTKYPEEAIKFLRFLTNQKNAEKLVAMLGWPSPIKNAVNSSNSISKLVEGLKAVEEAEGMALWLDTDINIKIADVYLPDLQELFNGDKTAEEIMTEVQNMAKEVKETTK
ncbi:extracellular solute-binding protein [Fusobacterium necrophorum]|uniref:Fructose amino acid-binding lipoprotein n=2 Tax=Fusobacterium necrophorum TaxID=859 RepID=A0AB73BYT3_9FUSO|nr:extracellular solute-binding protein [Fusobacterium necrophorum]AYZ74095.1 extracellular solute-binding protein [Fusobacterium necrophorum]AZW10026.1 extracellular solute-binding protein [Fusobacterium necrophorum subsp. necrophorum]KDE63611.1 hypothetical protein FUSO5_07615 [Fusobacterium necrophorum BFTR-1]KDE65358.1 fructose amino acid-binding lipoprotein [Fusobacterium necrophorum BL]KDE65548.1 hypothetical protein FUSO4_06400 [Fusobacterium necrophorum DJ-1]